MGQTLNPPSSSFLAGWDKQACIWDTQTGELLQQLSGHDEELTHASAHPTARLVVTSSKGRKEGSGRSYSTAQGGPIQFETLKPFASSRPHLQ